MLTIESAFAAYLEGDIGPWDLQEVVEEYGWSGWECTTDCILIVR